MYAKLDGTDLHAFERVIATGSVRAAADALGVEPSAVSRRLASLAARLGAPLFERRGRSVVPTEAAALVIEYCRDRRFCDDALRMRLDELRGLKRGTLRLMVGDGFVASIMETLIAEYCRRYPDIHVHVRVGGTDEVTQGLLDGACDIGSTLSAPAHRRIRVVRETARPIRLVAAPHHPAAALPEPIALGRLAAFRLGLAAPGTGLHKLLDSAAGAEGATLVASFTADRVGTLREYASAGFGVTFLSEDAIADAAAKGRLVARRTTSALLESCRAQTLVRADRCPTGALRAFTALMSAPAPSLASTDRAGRRPA